MSKYTTELRFICETYAEREESEGFNSVDEIIDTARTHVFSFSYPIFDTDYKPVLEKKILKHFYTREICAETVGLWKLWLSAKMNEIMPYYNKLYESELIEFNPMFDVDYKEEHDGGVESDRTDNANNSVATSNTKVSDGTNNSTGTNSRNENSSGSYTKWDYYNDTPQGGVNGLASHTYLTNATEDTDSHTDASIISGSDSKNIAYHDNTTDNGTVNGQNHSATHVDSTDEYLNHIFGKKGTGSYSKMLGEYRETFLNIDMMIIRDLEELFFQLW